MQTWSDAKLLRAYADNGDEDAFAELVSRHTNLVFSAALRQVNSPDLAAEIAQRVFVALALDARSLAPRLAPDASLAGWLCRSARNVSLNSKRDDFRRRAREEFAMNDLTTPAEAAPDWEQMRPVLDDAMSELAPSDYDAIVLRFYQNRDFRAVGLALGVSDDTAQKRVSRALDKLRSQLSRRGLTTTAAALSIALSAQAVQVAPAGLASSISTAAGAVHGAAAASTVLTATKAIVMTTLQKAVIAAVVAAAVGTGIYETHRASALRSETASLQTERDSLAKQLQQQRDDFTRQLAAHHSSNAAPGDVAEIAKLRAQIDRLHDQLAQAKAVQQDPAAAQTTAWLERVQKLRAKLAQSPAWNIPEFQYLTDDDWLNAVKDIKHLDSEADYNNALKTLQMGARNEFASAALDAMRAYAKANNNSQASEFSQIQPYFEKTPDDSVLQNYQFSQPGTVVTKNNSLIDAAGDFYSYETRIGPDGIGSSNNTDDSLHQAIQSYLAANNNTPLTDPSQLLPYVTTPAEKTALQKIIQGPKPQ